ncbi:MAG: hypothetical protein A4E45_02074 [Methanosaeta sp. PtaB.Bin039]|nr:MAG: hypothetical protein A4E45_02074 [Methanosaeta sp. PtaB.Bin039]OPY44521.1 MAG: hypothetical protein A4E47_01505 [Methanosaeta sp. PtaU1.Bin028]HOT06592.1 DUF2111 domain-containing protein [Methanotrichaceae archaeon]HQF16526.1 DUF2111 domain-containing protein [Methanotrichaceae archaeon]HQI91103.1 DUF2111 domain-containing protein [Methanotrichaceae archaeon]
MTRIEITEESGADDLAPLALAFNQIISLPVTIRSARSPGVRVEKGVIVDKSYTGPVLEKVLQSGRPERTIPGDGAFKGVPVSVAPIKVGDQVVAAVGVVDVVGTIDIPEVFGAYTEVVRQVSQGR